MDKIFNKKEEENEENSDSCIICGEKRNFFSIGECNHKQVCYYCTLKNRTFYDDKKCPLCNTLLNTVYICPVKETKKYQDLSKNTPLSFYKDNDSDNIGVYYTDISSLEEALTLKSFKCPIDYCVKEEPFETYELLSEHLMKNHQKFYCKVCLKDGKKFISEQNVYSKGEINDHNYYGDIDDDIPPHPKCPFCGDLFYNDELLYKHMTENHFLCEICKATDKKIIFYSVLPNLLEHNKLFHYCCPYKECQEVLYISFPNQKQLISHLESKHSQNNSAMNEKIARENMPKILEDPSLYNISLKKDEFNFSEFISRLNKRCIQHRENVEVQKEQNIQGNNKMDFFNSKNGEVEIEYKFPDRNYSNFTNFSYGKGNRKKNNFKKNNNKFRPGGINLIKQSFNQYIPPEEELSFNDQNNKNTDYIFILNFYLDLIKKYIIKKIKENKIKEDKLILPREIQYQLIMVIDKINAEEKYIELFGIQNFGIEWSKINALKDFLAKGDNIQEEEFYKELDEMNIKNILVLYKYITIAHKKLTHSFFKLESDQINEDLYENFIIRIENNKTKNNSRDFIRNNTYSSFSLSQTFNNNQNNHNQSQNVIQKKKKKNKTKWNQIDIPGLTKGPNKKNTKKTFIMNNCSKIENQPNKSEKQKKKEFDAYIKKCNEKDEKKETDISNDSNSNEEKQDKKNTIKSKLSMILNSNENNSTTKKNKKSKKICKDNFNLSYFNMDKDFPPLK